MYLRYLIFTLLTLSIAALQVRLGDDVPSSFSWGDFNNITYLNYVHDQNFPHTCNSGWAFSTINMLNSRIKIKRVGISPDITLSPQVLLSCDQLDFGCLGGEPITAIQWIYRNNITDSSCQTYQAKGYTNGLGCSSQIKCQICSADKCRGQYKSKIYSIQNYGIIQKQLDIMNEVYKNGPIACGIAVSDSLRNYTKGILNDGSGAIKNDHYVSIYGWGQQNGVKFWRVMNSWGTSWGQSGHFRIVKGKNNLGIQTRCFWANPKDTWTADIRNNTLPNQIKQYSSQKLIPQSMPKYLVPSESSMNPFYCSSAWAFALTTMMSDRLYKKTNGKSLVIFSVQNMLNCGVGTCENGGDPTNALQFIHKYGISQESCQAYTGKSPAKQSCTAINNCGTCKGTLYKENCTQVKNYKRWKIADYQIISGAQKMKAQIQSNGPIVCGIFASQKFKQYQTGIFQQISVVPKPNHYVQVIGWGELSGKQYWYVRNFWGTAWGQSGFIKMIVGSNNLGLETKCYSSGQFI